MVLLWTLFTIFCGLAVAQYVDPPNYGWGSYTEFDEYVNREDGYWSYREITSYRYENLSTTVYIVNMTSQKWMDSTFTSCSIWWHFMGIAIPDELDRLDVATLYIKGGIDNDEPPENIPANDSSDCLVAARYAHDSKTVGAFIMQVPNQPCVFANDPEQRRRKEDDVIAWTWKTFIDWYQSPTLPWTDLPLRQPMTKAAKRGLDTITAFVKEKVPASNILNFFTAGASKRGWTAWSIAFADRRVIATSPEVFSLIHMEESVMAHYRALGGAYSFALEPYYENNLTQFLLDPVSTDPGGLYDYEDPYRYRSRLTMPKLSVAATGDEFFLCQDFNFWFENMSEPKYIMMNPNAEHGLAPHYIRIYDTSMAFYLSILRGVTLPKLSWTMNEFADGGEIIFYTDPPPVKVEGWRSETLQTDDRRDYRLFAGYPEYEPHPTVWRNTSVEDLGGGVYRSWVDKDPDGIEWVAHFIEGTWIGPDGFRMYLTTQVNIVPNTFPAPPCSGGADCYGYLV